MHFENLALLLLIPLGGSLFLFLRPRGKGPGLRFPSGTLLKGLPESFRVKCLKKAPYIRVFSLLLIILALARPQSFVQESTRPTEGMDIVLSVDVSTSMLAEDFEMESTRRSRIEGVRKVIRDFILGRKGDRIGCVIFAGRPYLLSPLTSHYDWLLQTLERIEVGRIEDGTALGAGLSSALNRLRESPAKSKGVILLTDGRNNAGTIAPLVAAEAARALRIKVYTVGVGSKAPAPYPLKDPFGKTFYKVLDLGVDEEALMQIAHRTDGRYFRATDGTVLKEIFQEIGRLEKTRIEEKVYHAQIERFPLFLMPAIVLLLLEFFLRYGPVLRETP